MEKLRGILDSFYGLSGPRRESAPAVQRQPSGYHDSLNRLRYASVSDEGAPPSPGDLERRTSTSSTGGPSDRRGSTVSNDEPHIWKIMKR